MISFTILAPAPYLNANDREALARYNGTSDPGAAVTARDLIPTPTGGRNMTKPIVPVVPARNRPRASSSVPSAPFARVMAL